MKFEDWKGKTDGFAMAEKKTAESAGGAAGERCVCDVCGWEYEEAKGSPENGIAPGTKWEDIPDDFRCPLCGAPKEKFSKR